MLAIAEYILQIRFHMAGLREALDPVHIVMSEEMLEYFFLALSTNSNAYKSTMVIIHIVTGKNSAVKLDRSKLPAGELGVKLVKVDLFPRRS